MRKLKEIKDIVIKLEIIEEIKEPLQSLLDEINTLLHQGHEWIDSKVNKTYQEMKKLLDSEMAKFLRQCFCIASNGHEKVSGTALTVEQLDQASNFVSVDVAITRSTDGKNNELILGQIEELTANFTSQTEMVQTMQHKITIQDKNVKSISKLKQEFEEKFEEIMKELQEASNFMSNLSEELNETKEKEKTQDKKIQEISQNVVNYLEQRDSIADEKKKVKILKKEIKRLTDELVTANEIVNKKDKEIVRVIEVDDFQRCIEISIKEKRELDDEGVLAFWRGTSLLLESCGWSSRQEYVHVLYPYAAYLTGADLIYEITGMLNDIRLKSSEFEAFWDEYTKCLNTSSDNEEL